MLPMPAILRLRAIGDRTDPATHSETRQAKRDFANRSKLSQAQIIRNFSMIEQTGGNNREICSMQAR